ncbi:MAG: alpha/beta fold hydrolase [Verrucomicrobiota bacterium]
MCAPRHRQIGSAPKDLPAETFQIESSSGSKLSGWRIRAEQSKGTIILMHGVRGCRLDMLDRARFLHASGYSVILFDFQAHGESSGEHITFGYLESRDAIAVVEFAHQKFPGQKIAVIGGSLGGAAAILATPPLQVDAMVLEMVYPTVQQAISARLKIKLGAFGSLFSPLLAWQLKPRLGIGPDDLRPIDKVREITVPKLFIAGDADKHTPLPEAKELFNAALEPKQFWEIKGAGHVDLYPYDREGYQKRILNFLEQSFYSSSSK